MPCMRKMVEQSRISCMPSWRDVVEPADEGADVGRAGAGGQQRLVGAEDERGVDLGALAGQRADRDQALGADRHLDDDMLVPGHDLAALADHLVGVLGDDLGADRPLDDVADLADGVAEGAVALLLGQQRRIGRDAGQNAEPFGRRISSMLPVSTKKRMAVSFLIPGARRRTKRPLPVARRAPA